MFESLSDRLGATLDGLRGQGRLGEEDIQKAMREIRLALLEADVNFGVVRDFVAKVRERAMGAEVMSSLTPGQQVVKVVHDELTDLLGADTAELDLGKQSVILLAGLQGAGKTTAAGKLALQLRDGGRKPGLVAADLQRPAAIDQLEQLGAQIGVPVFRTETTDPVEAATSGLERARAEGLDTVIIDTAGRLQVDADLMDELERVSKAISPTNALLVLDAMTGSRRPRSPGPSRSGSTSTASC
jgi:signal recognition particle subunit SRP54